MNWQPTHDTDWQRYLIIFAVGTTLLVAGLLTVTAATDTARANVQLGGLEVESVNQTVDGVSDVQLSATLDYQVNVPDADMRVVELKAGPSTDKLGVVTFDHDGNPTGEGSGTVTLEGSLLDSGHFSAADLEPAMAETKQTPIVVAATIEVERANGETVTETVTQETTLTLTDSTKLTSDIGGSVDVAVVQ